MADGRSAAGPEWLPLECLVLTEITFHRIGDLGRCRVALSDGEPADLRRRRYVSLEQRGRNAEHVGDVVEAVTRVVCREQSGGVDLQREQVSYRVGVLNPVHAVERCPSRIWVARGEVIDRVLDRFREGIERSALGPFRTGRWHQTCPKFANHLLPGFGVRFAK